MNIRISDTLVNLCINAKIACWVKFSVENILKYLSYFFQKTGFDIYMQIGDNLHEMSNPVF